MNLVQVHYCPLLCTALYRCSDRLGVRSILGYRVTGNKLGLQYSILVLLCSSEVVQCYSELYGGAIYSTQHGTVVTHLKLSRDELTKWRENKICHGTK